VELSLDSQCLLAQADKALLVNFVGNACSFNLLPLKFIICQGFECLLASFLIDEALSFQIEQREDVDNLLPAENTGFEA
jgi:hypothetical protein